MAKRRRRRGGRATRLVVLVVVLAAVAVLGWRWYERRAAAPAVDRDAAAEHGSARIDPANEGRHVRLRGELTYAERPRDTQLGVGADAALLFRDVSMLQWQEHCVKDACSYATAWLGEPVDSARFRHPEGHVNPPMPFAPKRFDASNLRLDALAVDPEIVARSASVAHAVAPGELPPNLAATFHVVDGALVAGGDPDQPRVGTIRISYRIVPAGPVELEGVQRGGTLTAR